MNRVLLVCVIILVGLSGCSTEFVYDNLQRQRLEQCQKLPTRDQRVECQRQATQSHDAYEAERERVKQDPSKEY